jgi:hypothetical protein
MATQDKTGSIVLTEPGETLADTARGPDSEGPACTDWRVKAFELAAEIELLTNELQISERARSRAERKAKVLENILWILSAVATVWTIYAFVNPW